MTPDQLKHLFDVNAVILMFLWGLLCKYLPQLKNVPNNTIPWVNAIGYILASLGGGLVGTAHAGVTVNQVTAVASLGGALLGAFTNASWARLLYEGFARAAIEFVSKKKAA